MYVVRQWHAHEDILEISSSSGDSGVGGEVGGGAALTPSQSVCSCRFSHHSSFTVGSISGFLCFVPWVDGEGIAESGKCFDEVQPGE